VPRVAIPVIRINDILHLACYSLTAIHRLTVFLKVRAPRVSWELHWYSTSCMTPSPKSTNRYITQKLAIGCSVVEFTAIQQGPKGLISIGCQTL
jgi:hypothetical protein